MKSPLLSFDGHDCYEVGDLYEFTERFADWWRDELEKRVPDSKEFAKKYGKGWRLNVTFRCDGQRRKKTNLLGPFKDRHGKSVSWFIELPTFRFKSPHAKAYVPLMRRFLEQLVIVLAREQIDPSKIQKDSKRLLQRFASQPGMIEESLELSMETEKKAEKKQAATVGNSLNADKAIGRRLKQLRRKCKLRFGIAFDAT